VGIEHNVAGVGRWQEGTLYTGGEEKIKRGVEKLKGEPSFLIVA
jgi:hypothetical protein